MNNFSGMMPAVSDSNRYPAEAPLRSKFFAGAFVAIGILSLVMADTPCYSATPAQATLTASETNSSIQFGVATYELKISPQALNDLNQKAYSDQTYPATFLAGGKEYPVKVRDRGSWARSWPKKSWKIFFEKDHEYEGNHCLNLNSGWRDPAFIREPLAYQIYTASGVPSPLSRMVRLRINGSFYGLYVEVEQPDKPFLKRHHLKGASLYKASSRSNMSDERDLGAEKNYGEHYEKETQKAEGHRALAQFCHALANATNTIDFFQTQVDLDEYVNYLAATVLTQNWDCYNKNHFLVHDDGTGKWLAVPWDLDRTLGDHWHGSFNEAKLPLLHGTHAYPGPTGWNRLADRFFGNVALRTRLLNRLQTLLDKEFTREKLFPLLDRLESEIAADAPVDRRRWPGEGGNLHLAILEVKAFIDHRRAFLLQELARLRR